MLATGRGADDRMMKHETSYKEKGLGSIKSSTAIRPLVVVSCWMMGGLESRMVNSLVLPLSVTKTESPVSSFEF